MNIYKVFAHLQEIRDEIIFNFKEDVEEDILNVETVLDFEDLSEYVYLDISIGDAVTIINFSLDDKLIKLNFENLLIINDYNEVDSLGFKAYIKEHVDFDDFETDLEEIKLEDESIKYHLSLEAVLYTKDFDEEEIAYLIDNYIDDIYQEFFIDDLETLINSLEDDTIEVKETDNK